ncbi:MAG: endonuclease [Sphingobacteriales bacterium]|nr:endonuclease [Sphingobacteriales bacterium]MBP9142475.1 hypothetical protein [Chitinophagales bacterium]MDA0199398.1 endonuclease [Bacteroidota bacterium]MBK6890142.1 endonuclease [Sphingobacteriales bacterium]MBK7527331.1 endonuclease [Sphingobacteriales bacterium]
MNFRCAFLLVYTVACFLALPTQLVVAQTTTDQNISPADSLGDMLARPNPDFNDEIRGNSAFRLGFWNVENLMLPTDDPNKKDDEFAPTGLKGWGWGRYWQKQRMLAKVINALGGWEPIEVLGLCEIENDSVLLDLTRKTPLRKFKYDFIHYESPDGRGIDVALLYRPDKFTPLKHEAIQIKFPFDTAATTRDILYVQGRINNNRHDTLHLFVNHWPSRFGGHLETDPKRTYTAITLKNYVQTILKQNPQANIIIMGDLNDPPNEESVLRDLDARPDTTQFATTALYNLMHPRLKNWHEGTHKYEEHWTILDQFVVSGNLLLRTKGLATTHANAQIFTAPWLLEQEDIRLGDRLFRTYIGMKYVGGFSDHLPIILDLKQQ